nr:peptidoglycan-binding protein [Streptomyces sp. Alain-F2R5]
MSVKIISRAEWGARPWNGNPAYVAPKQRTEWFVHYDGAHHISATGNAVPQAIDRQHHAQGWAGIGYSFVVDQAGNAYEGRGWTRQGAHCPGHNISGLSVQIAVGGDQEPSTAALATARALYDEGCRRVGRTLAMRGHRDGIATQCPGNILYAWVQAGMPADGYEAPKGGSTSAPGKWDGKSFPGRSAFELGQSHPAVTKLGERLTAHGYGEFYRVGPGPRFTEVDKAAVEAFQEAQGWTGGDADGYPGPETWKRLMAAPKKKAPAKTPPPFPGRSAFVLGKTHPAVETLDEGLIRGGWTRHHDGNGYQAGPRFTEHTRRNVADFQRSRAELRGDPDGYPGPLTWRLLFS